MVTRAARYGFSLIEALVVLAIGGMALAIIFSIGVKAGDSGFSLGRKAMAAADADLAVSDLRSILRSVSVRPAATFVDQIDSPIVGMQERLEAEVVMERATQCAPQGWAGRLTLAVETSGDQRRLICSVGARRATLFVITGDHAAFSYSQDGQTWTPTYSSAPAAVDRGLGNLRSERVWVRFAAAPVADVVELATSGRPQSWARFDDF